MKSEPDKSAAVILCDCGKTLGANLAFDEIAAALKEYGRDRIIVQPTSRFCDNNDCRKTLSKALKSKPACLVIGACGCDDCSASLMENLKKVKFNAGLISSVNLKEHCAFVHSNRKEATDKAVRLLVSSIARAREQEPIGNCIRKMRPNVAVLGGGMAGIQAALCLAETGRQVTLVHRAPQLGGTAEMMAPFFGYLESDSRAGAGEMKEVLGDSIARAANSKNIRLISNAEVRAIEGSCGDFNVSVADRSGMMKVEAGAVILAVGSFSAFPFQKAGIAQSAKIIDLVGLSSMLAKGDKLPARIAILLDICGEQTRAVDALALGAAELLVREMKSDVKVYCHHARVAATGMEDLYRRARSAGVVVERSDKSPGISVEEEGIILRGGSDDAGEFERFDLVVTADSVPDEAVSDMARKANIRPGPEGWLQADNVWLLPTLSNRPGIFIVGAARGNNDFREAFNDASGAAAAIDVLLGSGRVTVAEDQARVDADKCVLCLTCVRSCPHAALTIAPVKGDEKPKPQVAVSESACRRCGICAALCPAQAIQLPRFTDAQAQGELERTGKVTVFACQNSAWKAATAAGVGRQSYGAEVQLVPVPCAGKTDSKMILRAFENGAAKVILLGCHRENCRYLAGADYASKRIDALRKKLEQAGLKADSLVVGNLTEFETGKFLEMVR